MTKSVPQRNSPAETRFLVSVGQLAMPSRRSQKRKTRGHFQTLEKRNLLFAPTDQISLLNGLESVEDSFERLESYAEFAQPIPGVDKTVGELTDLSDSIRSGLIDPLSTILTATTDVSASDIADALEAVHQDNGSVETQVVSGSVSVVDNDNATAATFEISAKVSQTRSLQLELGNLGEAAWIGWTNDGPEINAEIETSASLTFGVDLVADEFFVKLDSLTSHIEIDANAVSAELSVGPVNANVVDATLQLDANITTLFSSDALSESELAGSLEHFVSLTAGGSINASLPLEYQVGTYQGSETVTWQDSVIFDDTIPIPELADNGQLVNLIQVDSEDLSGFFRLLGTKLGELIQGADNASSDNGLLSRSLPWLDDLRIPDLSNVQERIENFVDQDLRDEEGRSQFSSFDELRDQLESLTNRDTLLDYLPATKELTYQFEIPAESARQVDLTVQEDYGALAAIDVSGTASAEAQFVLSGVFGVDLNALLEDTTPDDITDDDSWADHFYVDDLQLDGNVDIQTSDASAAAAFGFIGLAIGSVELSTTATGELVFSDPTANDGRISFSRLSELVISDPSSLIESAEIEGGLSVSLTEMSAEGIPGLELEGGEIEITIPDLSDPGSSTLDVNEALRNINSLSTVTLEQWVDLVGDVIDLVDELTSGGHWDRELPGLGVSVNDVIDQASKLQQAVADLIDVDTNTIQQFGEDLESRLEEVLGIDPSLVDITLQWKENALEMGVVIDAESAIAKPLSLDLATLVGEAADDSLALDTIEALIDVSGSTQVDISADVSTNLTFGVDVADIVAGNSMEPDFYVSDKTGVASTLTAKASNLETTIAAGPIGLYIRNGSLTIDRDGDANTTDDAELSVGLAATATGRYSPDDVKSISTDDLEVVFAAGASIVLPLYFPSESDPVGGTEIDNANAIVVAIGHVAGLFNDEDPQLTLAAPDLDSLLEDFDPVDQGLRVLAEGLEALLERIETLLRQQVLNRNLPMVGDRLEQAANFLRDVRQDVLPVLRDQLSPGQLVDEVKLVLHNALGTVLQLSDTNADGTVDYQDIELFLDTAAGEAKLDLSLGDVYEVDAGIDFDLGLPAIGLDLDGDVNVSLQWSLELGIGIDATHGFYVDTSNENEIEIDVQVTIPDVELTGSLGLFQVTVSDQGSSLNGEFDIDLKEPSGDGLLTFNELVSGAGNESDLIEATLQGGASVNLGVVAGTTFVALPELHADFVLQWGFDGSDLLGTVDRLAIENIELDLGSLISGFAGDILGRIQDVLAPVQPIVDILTAPLPVANDIDFLVDTFAAETTPKDSVNLLDFASLYGNLDVKMLDAIVQIIDLANSIPIPPSGESVMIPLGEVVIIGSSQSPSDVSTDSASIDEKDFADELDEFSGSSQQQEFASESSDFFSKMSVVEGGGFQFPILQNPASLIGVLLGQDATLFAYQTPRLSADFSLGITVPITGPLAVEFVGGIGVDAQFAFGYDTRGLRSFIESKNVLDLADGFFVSDRENVDGTGADIAELTLRGSLEAFATITTGVASVSVGGGIFATVDANLNDSDNDGKVRIGEFVENLPLCAFDLSGTLSAGLRVKAQVLGAPFSQNIATVKLLEFGYACTPAADLSLGQIDDDGVFTLYVGDLASKREVGAGITDEFVTFSETLDEDGNSVVEVSGFGVTETLPGVTRIVANAGDGNDSLVVIGSLDVPVDFHGGTGDDDLVGGSGDDTLRGGGGDDLLQGGSGDDQIFGGSGNDTLEGQNGNDSLDGGDRDDYLLGGTGEDHLIGGHGNDQLFGGNGMDVLDGGVGSDELYGQRGVDLINGGDGDDLLDGGDQDDALEGGDGKDTLLGRSGDDYLHGGFGNDLALGGPGNDIIFGGFDADDLSGGLGRDVIIGGNDRSESQRDDSADVIAGDDGDDILIGDDGGIVDFDGTDYIIEVIGGTGDDWIDAGQGNDWAHGVGGRDEIFGQSGDDHLLGGDDADAIFGADGNDWIEGGAGDDQIEGHTGGDLIGGGLGADLIDGGDDEDQIYSHETGGAEPWYLSHVETDDDGAADTIFGRNGTDEIVGGIGNDLIDAGRGDDAVIGGLGDDSIQGGQGDDYIDITLGVDTVLGNWGSDQINIGKQSFATGAPSFALVGGDHGGKDAPAKDLSNDRTNKLVIAEQNVVLDFIASIQPSAVREIDQIDGRHQENFQITLDRASINQITDQDNQLRLDLNETANAELSGQWTEEDPVTIDEIQYRKLVSQGTTLLVTDLKPRQRIENRFDVNGDGEVTPLDALLIINRLSQISVPTPVLTKQPGGLMTDVTGDNQITPLDALQIINQIARKERDKTTGI